MSWKLYSKISIDKGLRRRIDYDFEQEMGSSWLVFVLYHIQYWIFFVMSIPCRIPVLDLVCNFIATNCPRGIIGFVLRGVYWKTKLGKIGVDVFIDKGFSVFPNAKNIFIGNSCHIDVNVTVSSLDGVLTIGDRVYIGANSFINCRPFIKINNDVAIGVGCTILGGESTMMNNNIIRPACSMSNGHCDTLRGVILDDFSAISPNCVIVPTGVLARPPFSIIEGPLRFGIFSLLGANSFLADSIDDGEVWAGSPAKKIIDFKDFAFDMYEKDSKCFMYSNRLVEYYNNYRREEK